jgi:hypothetical protein
MRLWGRLALHGSLASTVLACATLGLQPCTPPLPAELERRILPEDRHDPYIENDRFVWCDSEFGCSQSFPFALRIHVRSDFMDVSCNPDRVGALVKQKLFPTDPDFEFRVVFAQALNPRNDEAAYADPRSLWYDVYFGAYTITWRSDHPFGYTQQANAINHDDIVRIGLADWNYFTNRVYGVPLAKVDPYSHYDLTQIGKTVGRERIGKYTWDAIEYSSIDVVGPYRADALGPEEVYEPCLTKAWREIFGQHRPIASQPTSYVPAKIHAKIYLCFEKHGNEYRTHIFGGTVNANYPDAAENQRFLDRQLKSIRSTIESDSNLSCDPAFQ